MPRFGRKSGQAKLQFSNGSHRSNMLQPMSDVVSMKGEELDNMTVVERSAHGESNWRPDDNQDKDSNDSAS